MVSRFHSASGKLSRTAPTSFLTSQAGNLGKSLLKLPMVEQLGFAIFLTSWREQLNSKGPWLFRFFFSDWRKLPSYVMGKLFHKPWNVSILSLNQPTLSWNPSPSPVGFGPWAQVDMDHIYWGIVARHWVPTRHLHPEGIASSWCC